MLLGILELTITLSRTKVKFVLAYENKCIILKENITGKKVHLIMLINTGSLIKHHPFFSPPQIPFYHDHLKGQWSKNNKDTDTNLSLIRHIGLSGRKLIYEASSQIGGQQRHALFLTLKDALGFSASSVLPHMAQQTPLLLLASPPGLARRVVKSSALTSCRLHMKANRRISLYKQLVPIQICILDSGAPDSEVQLMISSIETKNRFK